MGGVQKHECEEGVAASLWTKVTTKENNTDAVTAQVLAELENIFLLKVEKVEAAESFWRDLVLPKSRLWAASQMDVTNVS